MSDETARRHANPAEPPRRGFLFVATGAVGYETPGRRPSDMHPVARDPGDTQSKGK